MRPALSRTTVIALAVVACAIPAPVSAQAPRKFENVSSAPPRTPEEERKGFHLPPGFVVELVASEPDIGKPLNMAFDARGRLWVTESFEYPFAAEEGTRPRDAVRILEDFGPDGKARKVRVFADGLVFPMGLAWRDGRLYVADPPDVVVLEDTDGDDRVDRRTAILTGFGHLVNAQIDREDIEALQENLVRSHAAGAGRELIAEEVRGLMLTRANALAKAADSAE